MFTNTQKCFSCWLQQQNDGKHQEGKREHFEGCFLTNRSDVFLSASSSLAESLLTGFQRENALSSWKILQMEIFSFAGAFILNMKQ